MSWLLALAAFHIWPELRIMAGMEASTITSLGTCRLVMPLSELTIASCGAGGVGGGDVGLDGGLLVGGERGDLGEEVAEAVVQIDAERGEGGGVLGEEIGKNTRTTWPKMIGSETFIIVALRWTEKRTPSALALAICCGEEGDERGFLRRTVASMISPALRTGSFP